MKKQKNEAGPALVYPSSDGVNKPVNKGFKCKGCGILFTRNDAAKRMENRFVWFRKWILEQQTYQTLQRDRGFVKRYASESILLLPTIFQYVT